MGIRNLANEWLKRNHPDELNNKMRVSKYHPQDIWFFTFPTSYFDKKNSGYINILLQFEEDLDQFIYLKVPFDFLRDNQTEFSIRDSGDKFDLHISAKEDNFLIDERSKVIGFYEFAQNLGSKQGKRRPKAGNDKKRKKRTQSKRTLINEWFKILEVPPTASLEDIRHAYRKQMSMYHPDKVAQLGKELRQLAEYKSKEINNAYEEACRQYQN